MIVAAHAGTGKTTFARMYSDKVVDFVCMPYKYYLDPDKDEGEAGKASLDNIIHAKWPLNYVDSLIEQETAYNGKKIFLIPPAWNMLALLEQRGEAYILCYPQRDARDVYKKRYTDRGNSEEFLHIFVDGWDGFLDQFERDMYGQRIVMQPERSRMLRLSCLGTLSKWSCLC